MDTTDIAAAARNENHKARCHCYRNTQLKKPKPTCVKCKGTGTITACSHCAGSGWDRSSQSACIHCNGNGCL